MTECDEIVIVIDNLSTKKTNTIATNIMSTTSINCYSKKVRYYYILNVVLLVIIFLLIITIICYNYDGTRYLTLFASEKYDTTYNRIISQKSDVTSIFSHYFAKIKVDSFNSLTIAKRLTLHNVIIHIKSVLNKDKNHYYYKIFLEKCSYQLAKK